LCGYKINYIQNTLFTVKLATTVSCHALCLDVQLSLRPGGGEMRATMPTKQNMAFHNIKVTRSPKNKNKKNKKATFKSKTPEMLE
jgi:hypothetical protein